MATSKWIDMNNMPQKPTPPFQAINTHQSTRLKRLVERRLKPATKHLTQRFFDQKSQVQSDQLAYQVISTFDKAQLRFYPSQTPTTKHIPLVIVAPLAVKMSIYDLFPERSLLGYLTANGFDVYLTDWGKLNRRDRHLDFEYFIFKAIPHFMQAVRTHSNSQDVSLHGWSMGGIFTLLYSASNQDQHIRNIVIMGSPIDAHSSGPIGQLFAKSHKLFKIDQKGRQAWLEKAMNNHFLHTSGWLNALGYKLLNPIKTLDTHWQMLKHSHDLGTVKAHATLSDFLDDMVDYPGAINRDMLLWVWLQNPLKTGQANYKNYHFDFKRIQSAMLLAYGDNDDIVTEQAMLPLLSITSSQDIELQSVPGGHLGMISGRSNAAQFWPKLVAWLSAHSTPAKVATEKS